MKGDAERGSLKMQWIFGAIDCQTNEMRLEICPENKRDRETLIPLIKKHIAPDTTIFSDCWRVYEILGSGYEYLSVNHSINFVDFETGANTQHI